MQNTCTHLLRPCGQQAEERQICPRRRPVRDEGRVPTDGLLSDRGRSSTGNGQQMRLVKHRRKGFMARAARHSAARRDRTLLSARLFRMDAECSLAGFVLPQDVCFERLGSSGSCPSRIPASVGPATGSATGRKARGLPRKASRSGFQGPLSQQENVRPAAPPLSWVPKVVREQTALFGRSYACAA